MDKDPFKLLDQIDAAKADLSDALRIPEVIIYAEGMGLIPIEMVEPVKFEDPKFRETVDRLGWPNVREDGDIAPTNGYHSGRQFLESLMRDGGSPGIETKHFFNLVSSPPVHRSRDVTLHRYGGLEPVVHRSHALTPELFGPLQQVLLGLVQQYSGMNKSTDLVYEWLKKPENQDIPTAMYSAYRIMGRLLKRSDSGRTADFQLRSEKIRRIPVTNADQELRIRR